MAEVTPAADMRGFGGHAGFSGGHGGGFSGSGGHVSSGMHSGPVASRGFTHSPSRTPNAAILTVPICTMGIMAITFTTDTHVYAFYTYGFRNNCYGYACRGYGYGYGYPWAYGAYYDPRGGGIPVRPTTKTTSAIAPSPTR